MVDGRLLIEKILAYAKCHLHLSSLDEIYVRNTLLYEFGLEDPADEIPDLSFIEGLSVPDCIFNEIKEYAVENKLVESAYAEIFATYIMGIVTPRPSEINNVFNTLKEKLGPQAACSYLFDLSIKNNYIQKTAIDRNILWEFVDTANSNRLEITINLSKPEKDNKEIAKLLQVKPQSNKKYPACLLCKENEGFKGTLTHPARSNLRTISIKLGGANWYLQYSPYQYYDEHCIIFGSHVPMTINSKTISNLLDFIDLFPNYFAGSNADLPIVGGSILNHEHYQGGKHLMPMHYAEVLKQFKCAEYPDVEIGLLNWYNTVLHLTSFNRNTLNDLAGNIINAWSTYNDESAGIIGMENGVRHNTVTPIARFMPDGRYCVDLILRNNLTSEQYPDGIYHAHPEYHNIKKEGIGLIEAMGLYILPGRLKKQMSDIQDILVGTVEYNEEEIFNESHPLYVHREMIKQLVKRNRSVKTKAAAEKITTDYINKVCAEILKNTSVFAKTDEGNVALSRFLNVLNIK